MSVTIYRKKSYHGVQTYTRQDVLTDRCVFPLSGSYSMCASHLGPTAVAYILLRQPTQCGEMHTIGLSQLPVQSYLDFVMRKVLYCLERFYWKNTPAAQRPGCRLHPVGLNKLLLAPKPLRILSSMALRRFDVWLICMSLIISYPLYVREPSSPGH